MGRTGRRQGQRANIIFFYEDTETVLQAIALVELTKKGWVESAPINNRVWSVLVHQILALKYEIQVQRDWKIFVDNFKLKIEGRRVTTQSLKQIIADLSTNDFWQDSLTQS